MSRIISIHSFRGGTGKSNTTANLAMLLAIEGYRVGVVDTDIASPGIHVLFGLKEEQMIHSLNDYLWGSCSIQETAHDVTACQGISGAGKIYLVPSSIKAGEIARILRDGYNVELLSDGFRSLIRSLKLDVLLIDTHPGLNEETLLTITMSNCLLIVLRPDQQDYQGTGVTIEVARKLKVPNMLLIVNRVPATFSSEEVKVQVENAYHMPVAAVLPNADEVMTLASAGVFACHYPAHPIVAALKQVTHQMMA